MKFKIAILAIFLSTLSLIGLVNIIVGKISGGGQEVSVQLADEDKGHKKETKNIKISDSAEDNLIRENGMDDDDDALEPEASIRKSPPRIEAPLNDDDAQKIKLVANLSDNDLNREIETLKNKIEEDEIFEQLEDGELSKEEEIEAKKVLEKFALLGLEKNRRKYMAVDPDLKDALYAHRESLKEIREVLDEE